MSQPIIRHSVQAQAATGAGSSVAALGHYHSGLFVSAASGATSLTVQLEVTPNGSDWATATHLSGGAVEITESDLDGNGNAHIAIPGLYAQAFRANVTAYEAAGDVDAFVITAGNAGQGRKPTGRKGPVSDLGLG